MYVVLGEGLQGIVETKQDIFGISCNNGYSEVKMINGPYSSCGPLSRAVLQCKSPAVCSAKA